MRIKHVISIGALILGSSVALAGKVQPAPVLVTLNDDGSGSASGDMVSARFSDNEVEAMGCGIRRFDDGAGNSYEYAFCQATAADAVRGVCFTESPTLIKAVADVSDYSYISFAWNVEGDCIAIGSSTQSFYIPGQ